MAMRTLTDALASFMRQSLPAVLTESKELGREAVQTVVWLVGLATGLITLIAAHSGLIAAFTINQRRVLIPALAATITFGVLQRIVYQLADQRERNLFFRLQSHLAVYEEHVDEPDELENHWSQDEIIQRINRDFETDLTRFADLNLPIDFYRTLYSGHLDSWNKSQSKRLNNLLEVLNAYGMHDPSSAMQSPADSLRFTKRLVAKIGYLRRCAFICFLGTCISFLFALLFLAYAIFP
jgi:hypothetical protein